MNPEHPKAIAAREAAERRNELLARKLEQINRAKRNDQVRFVHAGRHTICYRVDFDRVIEFSTAIRNPHDKDNKIIGQHEALTRFAQRERALLRVPNGWNIDEFFHFILGTTFR